MVIIQNVSQNCILLPSMTTQNITFKNIFKYVGTNNFNIEELKYSIVMYNNHSKFDYEIKYICRVHKVKTPVTNFEKRVIAQNHR